MLLPSCRKRIGGGDSTRTNNEDTISSSISVKPNPHTTKVHVFVENSGSMNGFINHTSDFQVALSKQIALLVNYYGIENIRLYYINQEIYPQRYEGSEDGLIEFAKNMLTPTKFRNTGKVGSTKLNHILKMALDSVSCNAISIVVSDCIYSVQGSGTSHALLGTAQSQTMSKFMNKAKTIKTLSTTLIQLESDFNGGYWDYKHPSGPAPIVLNCKRPYYLCVIGTHENVLNYEQRIDVKSMAGFCNQFTISNKDVSKTPSSFLSHEGKIGEFRIESNNAAEKRSIIKVNRRNGILGVGVALNLSEYTISEKDKCDPDNYEIEGNYKISNIEKIDDRGFKPSDCEIIENNGMTHIIYLESTGFPDNFTIKIKRRTPTWVEQCSSSDDSAIATDAEEQKRTFGLKYLVDGITDAYLEMAEDENYYTKLMFKVNM